jgi:two-component system response regulator YesN
MKENTHEELIYQLKAFIDENYVEDISLDVLSQKTGLSASYISTLFGEVMGVSFSEYLTSHRLKEATDLLKGSNASVKNISSMVGYRNVQYFCTKFKDKYGVTPIQYRKSKHSNKALNQSLSQ